ncbi:MAG TPA: hypothetical protein VKT19_02410, partial [Steroidobacteraceae bacterium]|nr:hypothetical protein [Steroidobacteraceae bacterium]
MRVQLIGEANGGGISRDLALLGAALRACGCEVSVRSCGKPERRQRRSRLVQWRIGAALRRRRRGMTRASGSAPAVNIAVDIDVNVMLEHVWPQFLPQARYNVVVPNPEWFDPRDVRYLSVFDYVWAKTAFAERLFRERGCATALIGFDSEDRATAGVSRLHQFLHVAGRSPLKGTARLAALWRRHPEWPPLTLVQDALSPATALPEGNSASNVVWHRDYLSDETLRQMQNAHRFHVCTSEAEGWGHYIAEAMSVGAVTMTCDAAPMNELIAPGRGMRVAAMPGVMHNLARLALFDEAALEAAVSQVLGLGTPQLEAIGAAARDWFLENKAGFAP